MSLGITIARQFARSYGGDVWVRPGTGASFAIELRRAVAVGLLRSKG
jgi:C4-dicarboxylate-specific signal transduction histidine kinase